MITKYYNKKLYTFEKVTGMTGIFSEKELDTLLEYSESGIKTPFINRLYDLGILIPESDFTTLKNISDQNISLESLHIDITDSCPLSCPQCYKGKPEKTFMDFQNFKSIVDEAVKLNIFQIALGGGEALVHPEIGKFISSVAETQLAVSITTSGFSLNEEKLQDFILRGVNHIQISLNSIDEKVNSLSRDGFRDAVKAIALLKKTGLSFGINTVIRKDNLNTLSKTIGFAKENGADNINLLRYKPSGFETFGKISPDKNDLQKVSEIIRSIRGIKIKLDSAFSNLLLYVNSGNISYERVGCAAGIKFISITPEGVFKPCSHQSYAERADSIEAYIQESKYIQKFKTSVFHNESICTTCIYRLLCKSCRVITEKENVTIGETDCIGYRKE